MAFTSETKAKYWIYKLNKWKQICTPSEIEIKAIDAIIPRITKECFEDSLANSKVIGYIEKEWLPSIQPYINFDRLVMLASSPYFFRTRKSY